MAVAATGVEILAKRSLGSVAESLPTVLDDLTLTVKRTPVQDGADSAVVTGVWVRHLRRIGAAKLRYWGFSAQVDDAVLLISELVTNACAP
ncbi:MULTISPECIES: hypothetical protein [Streptomyces]|uniref:hypothetical protein n=1 Tax=Streptomyces TaxID=1883 RepID=UPI000B9EBA62|nr:hypothetical protein [Streptomyces kasugaensis]